MNNKQLQFMATLQRQQIEFFAMMMVDCKIQIEALTQLVLDVAESPKMSRGELEAKLRRRAQIFANRLSEFPLPEPPELPDLS